MKAVDWVRDRFVPKYQRHIVRTGLEPGWHDCDEVMLHACFTLLCRYVEDEEGGAERLEQFSKALRQHTNGDGPDEMSRRQADRQDEAVFLYRWWTVTRPQDQTLRDKMVDKIFSKGTPFLADEEREFWALEDKIKADEQAMLHRLIDIRGSLWT